MLYHNAKNKQGKKKKNPTISLTFAQVIFCCIRVIRFNKWLQVMHCYFPLCINVCVSVTSEGSDIKSKKEK